MVTWQKIALIIYSLVALLAFFRGYNESKKNRNAYGLVPFLLPWGIIAWGDAIIFGPFWILVSFVTIALNDWYLFLLVLSIFWVVRSLGETIYWFNQQFSSRVYEWTRPENLPFHKIFHDDSIWYIFQIANQCITVIAIIFSIYFAKIWLAHIGTF